MARPESKKRKAEEDAEHEVAELTKHETLYDEGGDVELLSPAFRDMIEECAPTYLPSLHLTDDRLETSIVLQQVFGVLAHQRGFVTCVSIEEGFERSIQSILLCQKYNIEMYTRIARGELQLLQAKLRIERLEAEPEYAQDGDIAFFERFLLGLSLNAVDAALYSFWNWLLRNGVSSPTTSAFMLLNVAHYTMVPPGLMCALHAMENAYQQGALEDAEDLECTLQKWLDEHDIKFSLHA